jgi:hypothetical protein
MRTIANTIIHAHMFFHLPKFRPPADREHKREIMYFCFVRMIAKA